MSLPSPAPEVRKKVGFHPKKNPSSGRSGRNWVEQYFFRPIRGFAHSWFFTHGFTVGYFRSPLRGLGLAIFFLAATSYSQTNTLSDAEIKGRDWAQRILDQRPITNSVVNGVLTTRDQKRTTTKTPIQVEIPEAPTDDKVDWETRFGATTQLSKFDFRIFHRADKPTVYTLEETPIGSLNLKTTVLTKPSDFAQPFANSEFSLCDLGLEFLHWPNQKFIKNDIHRSCGCIILESTNPDPGTNGYSRVQSWIDTDSLGIVEAYAYDRNGKQLKDFYPDKVKKVNGQWQVETLVMENTQTGSRSRIEFDLNK